MKIKYPDCHVTFLPSEHGTGYTATIRHDLGHGVKGWSDWYGHLAGIAKDFAPMTEWEESVKNRLISQGIQFTS